MENRNTIIIGILVLIILVLACIMGVMFLPHSNAQKDSKIVITGNKTLYAGDNLTVKLTDLNKTPIDHGSVNVTITDKDGKAVVEKLLKTNSKGKANMKLDLEPGKYTVNATFGGNDNFTGNNTIKKITIEEVAMEEPAVQQTSSASETQSSSSQSSEYGSYINDEWVSMSESEYAERYPALYHIESLEEGRYDKYHPEMYEVDRENGRI